MQEHEAVRPPFAREVGERAVDLLLHLLLPDEGAARQGPLDASPGGRSNGTGSLQRLARGGQRLPGKVEDVEAGEVAPRVDNRGLAVVVEDVAQVPARVARVAERLGVEELEELGEREDATPSAEALLDLLGDGGDLRRGGARLAHAPEVSTAGADIRAITSS